MKYYINEKEVGKDVFLATLKQDIRDEVAKETETVREYYDYGKEEAKNYIDNMTNWKFIYRIKEILAVDKGDYRFAENAYKFTENDNLYVVIGGTKYEGN